MFVMLLLLPSFSPPLSRIYNSTRFQGNSFLLRDAGNKKKCLGILFRDIEYECMVMSFSGWYTDWLAVRYIHTTYRAEGKSLFFPFYRKLKKKPEINTEPWTTFYFLLLHIHTYYKKSFRLENWFLCPDCELLRESKSCFLPWCERGITKREMGGGRKSFKN